MDQLQHWSQDPYWTDALREWDRLRQSGQRTITLDLNDIERVAYNWDGPAYRLMEAMVSVKELEGDDGFRGAPRVLAALLVRLQQPNRVDGVPGRSWANIESEFNQIVRKAVLEFAKSRYQTLARKVVARMQRIKASGIFGDALRARTLWDEYCYWIQEGPIDGLEWAWESTVTPILSSVIHEVPREDARLLTLEAAKFDDDFDEEKIVSESELPCSPEHIGKRLEEEVSQIASSRDLDRLGGSE